MKHYLCILLLCLSQLTFAQTNTPEAVLKHLKEDNPKVKDLDKCFSKRPLTKLSLAGVGEGVNDISALKGLPLTELSLFGTKVSDISALKGMPLTHLTLTFSQIMDIGALKGMKLTQLNLDMNPNPTLNSNPNLIIN